MIRFRPTESDIIIGPIAQKRKQSPLPPVYNVISLKTFLPHVATLKRGRGVFRSNFA